ncbi:MAG: JAB domain-containing protein [Gemmataceae bacterium]|nr:JAB domain-containing protein [Gemmataceae bacterium]
MTTLNYRNRTPALAELKVSYRRSRQKSARPDTKIVPNADAAIAFFRGVWDDGTLDLREEFLLLCLNLDCEVLGWVKLSTGNREATALDPRAVFGVALKTASAAIVVAHNHPGGPCRPSPPDIEITRRLEEGANLLGIMLLDHIILTRDEAFSFGRAGLLGN